MLAAIIVACSLATWDPHAILENTPVYSRNGRFCAIVRHNEGVPDFGSSIARELPEYDENTPSRNTVTTALYEERSLIAEIPIDVQAAQNVLVSDSGQYLVALAHFNSGVCAYAHSPSNVVIAIYRSNGALVRSIRLSDLGADGYDADLLRFAEPAQFQLRSESDTREVVALSVAGQERRIDLATGELLDPKHEFFRHPHVFVTGTPSFLSLAAFGPMPKYPDIARKARVGGTVPVSVVVSETGNVISVAVLKPLPFGMDAAAIEAAKQWVFLPQTRDGRPVQFTGELLFHFEKVWEDVWQEAMRHAPPG